MCIASEFKSSMIFLIIEMKFLEIRVDQIKDQWLYFSHFISIEFTFYNHYGDILIVPGKFLYWFFHKM